MQKWPLLEILVAPVSTPLDQSSTNLACLSRPMVYTYAPNFIQFGVFCRPWESKKPNFTVFQPWRAGQPHMLLLICCTTGMQQSIAVALSGCSLWTLRKHLTTLTTTSSSTNLNDYNCQTSLLIGSALSSATSADSLRRVFFGLDHGVRRNASRILA